VHGSPASEDDEIGQCLDLLQLDSSFDQQGARCRLADVFDRRGMLDEAVDLLITNIEAGERTERTYRHLASLYRRQGQEALALRASVEARRIVEELDQSATKPEVWDRQSQLVSDITGPAPLREAQQDGPASVPATDRLTCRWCGDSNSAIRSSCLRCKRSLISAEAQVNVGPFMLPAATVPWYRQAQYIIGWSFIFFPVGLTLIWLTSPWNARTRARATVAILTVILGVVAFPLVTMIEATPASRATATARRQPTPAPDPRKCAQSGARPGLGEG
jgi:hypothetical protein